MMAHCLMLPVILATLAAVDGGSSTAVSVEADGHISTISMVRKQSGRQEPSSAADSDVSETITAAADVIQNMAMRRPETDKSDDASPSIVTSFDTPPGSHRGGQWSEFWSGLKDGIRTRQAKVQKAARDAARQTARKDRIVFPVVETISEGEESIAIQLLVRASIVLCAYAIVLFVTDRSGSHKATKQKQDIVKLDALLVRTK